VSETLGFSDRADPLLSSRPMRSVALAEGVRIGLALGVCVVLFAVLGLGPASTSIPEVPLIAAAVGVPIAGYALAGARAAARTQRWLAGLAAGAIAGALSGAVGGASYVLFGKPLLNIPVGLVLGAIGGALVGAAAGIAGSRRRR
jgi:hypothetical protein